MRHKVWQRVKQAEVSRLGDLLQPACACALHIERGLIGHTIVAIVVCLTRS